jgi:hypothetical protein
LCHTLDIQSSTRAPHRVLSWPWVAVLLLVLSVGMHADLVRQLSAALPSDLGDPLLSTWILWWNTQQIPFTDAYWNAPAFAPMTRALALSETLLGLTWLTTPLQWLGASPVAAYNILFVLTPVLNGLCGYWLCLVLTARRDAALVGAVAMAFSPYRATQLSHIQTEAIFFMPLALGALHRYWTTGDRRWLALFSAATALNALVCGYFLLFFAIFVAIAVTWLTLSTRDVRKLGATLAASAIAVLAISPVIVTFQSVRDELGLSRGLPEIEQFSADASSLLLGSAHLVAWPIATPPDRPDLAAYPGLVIVFVIVAGAVIASRGRITSAIAAESKWLLGLLGLAVTGIVVGAAFIPRPYKVISVGIYLATIAVLASKRFRSLVQSASIPALYATALVAAIALSLGPVGRVFGHRFWYKPPYALLMGLPGFDAARVPARFTAIEVICLAVLAAFAITRLWPTVTRASIAATAIIASLIVVDGWARVPVVEVPAPPPATLAADMVIELPAYGWVENVQAMYRGMFHGRPVVNGYSGYVPPDFARLQRDLFKDCVKNLDGYRAGRSIEAIVWKDKPGTAVTDAQLREMWPAAIREETRLAIVYRQPRSSSLPDARQVNRCQ